MIAKAELKDLNEIDELAIVVIEDMASSEIPQWNLNYPRKEHFETDVLNDALIIYKDNNRILGCMAFLPENDPPYKTINSWIKEHSLVIHRVLVHPETRGLGIAKKMLDYVVNYGRVEQYDSIKIDTHLDNYKMRKFLLKNGFIELEYIEVMDRLAFELVLEGNNE